MVSLGENFQANSSWLNVTGTNGEIRSLDRFNDEDLAEIDELPIKSRARGLLLDKMFTKGRGLPGSSGAGAMKNEASGNMGGRLFGRTSGGFGYTEGDQTRLGLGYGSDNDWSFNGQGTGFASGSGSAGVPNWFSWIPGAGAPMAGPPMFIVPSPAGTTTPAPGATGTSATTADPSATTAAPGSTTLKPADKAEALVRAFGGGERPRIQQMGPPVVVPMGSVPGLRSLSGMNKPLIVKPGEQMPLYGKIVLGPPKFLQSVAASDPASGGESSVNGKLAGGGSGTWGIRNRNKAGLQLIRWNKPAQGVNFANSGDYGGSFGGGQSFGNQYTGQAPDFGFGDMIANFGRRGGFRSVEPYNPPPAPAAAKKAPPIIKYVPVVETVKRKRLKAILVDPE